MYGLGLVLVAKGGKAFGFFGVWKCVGDTEDKATGSGRVHFDCVACVIADFGIETAFFFGFENIQSIAS